MKRLNSLAVIIVTLSFGSIGFYAQNVDPKAQEPISLLASKLANDESWWEARDSLLSVSLAGHRLDVHRALARTWLRHPAETVRKRIRLVRKDIDSQWARRIRDELIVKRLRKLEAEVAKLVHSPEVLPESAGLVVAVRELGAALRGTPHEIATQGFRPFGPELPSGNPLNRPHDPNEVVKVKAADGTVLEARWQGDKLIADYQGSQIVLVKNEGLGAAEFAGNVEAGVGRMLGIGTGYTQSQEVEALRRGTRFLLRTQLADGSWPRSESGSHDAVFDTAIAGLALCGSYARTSESSVLAAAKRAASWLIHRIPKSGQIRVQEPSQKGYEDFECWYATFAMMFLVELDQVSPCKDSGKPIRGLAKRLLRLRRWSGGWNHDFDQRLTDSHGYRFAHYSEDLLVLTNFTVFALYRARKSGHLEGTSRLIWRELRLSLRAYYLGLQNVDGGFQYGSHHGWRPSLMSECGRTSGALLALRSLIPASAPMIQKASSYVSSHLNEIPVSSTHGGNLFMINYLSGALGCRAHDVLLWQRFQKIFIPVILKAQDKKGAFVLNQGLWYNKVNTTATGVVVLALRDPSWLK